MKRNSSNFICKDAFVVALTVIATGCGGNNDNSFGAGGAVVVTDDDAVQCVRAPRPAEETAQLLWNAGVDVLKSSCGNDTRTAFPTSCGTPTSGVHLHKISPQNVVDAEQLGFQRVEDLDAFSLRDCPPPRKTITTSDFQGESYVFHYEETGFTPLEGQWEITVADNEVNDVSYLGTGTPEVPLTAETAPTISNLLADIESCETSAECKITVLAYDEEDFYPAEFYRSYGEEGNGFIISDFLRTE